MMIQDLIKILCFSFVLIKGHGIEDNHESHTCIHDSKLDEFEKSVDMGSITAPQYHKEMRKLQANAGDDFKPMRISFDISKLSDDSPYMCTAEGQKVNLENSEYTCTKDDVLTVAKREMLTSVLLQEIKDYFAKTLSVKRIQGNLYLPGLSCSPTAAWACCSNTIPAYFSNVGIPDSDFVLHVTARPTTGGTIAWALPCNTDEYGRPVSGHANFSPAKIDAGTRARPEQIGTALHEMTHALGFSRSRFSDFRQPANGERWGEENIFKRETVRNSVSVTKLITPKLIREVKKHFDCYNWVNAGVELENGAEGSSSFSSHFEKRLFNQEYMTATSNYDPIYSALTLALLEDSGWYIANYDHAQLLPWGFHEGCGFATGNCAEWTRKYFCSTAGEQKCTPTHSAKGYCNLMQYSESLPLGFQYFSQPQFGGRDSYEDYCPAYKPYNNGDCSGKGRVATYYDASAGEEVGPESRCFESNLHDSQVGVTKGPACYTVVGCTSSSMQVSIGGNVVDCPLEGGEIEVPNFYGVLVCPISNKICELLQDQCSGKGSLNPDGTCTCNPGFIGDLCEGIVCPTSQSNDEICSGSDKGNCDETTGTCICSEGYTGLDCSELICPIYDEHKFQVECSNHGTCNKVFGTCSCNDGYSGPACECVPGCSSLPAEAQCSNAGTCDCTNGGCTCDANTYGVNCEINGPVPVTEVQLDGAALVGQTVAEKEYKFYTVSLPSSTYDVSVILTPTSGDADLYASFDDDLPNSLTSRSVLFSSIAEEGQDIVHFCGSNGEFPRAVNDTFRFCNAPTANFIQGAPGNLHIAVFGYKQSSFSIEIIGDKCQNIDCSNHGVCGKKIAGICACDRLWTGPTCAVPQCRPDCFDDDVDCEVDEATAQLQLSGEMKVGLRQQAECYGNGECFVVNDVPTCVCDDTHYYPDTTDRTDAQSLCKELIPSISKIEHYDDDFLIVAESSALQLDVGNWAVYTLEVKPEWNLLHIILATSEVSSDPMLMVRKGKMPSLDVYPPVPMQYTDSVKWTQAGTWHQVALARGTSTLSDGLWYIAVHNSRYARGHMAYVLRAQGYESSAECSPLVCSTQGACNASPEGRLCTCAAGFAGDYCEIETRHYSLTLANATADINDLTMAKVELHSKDQSLEEGEWEYFSFDVPDPSVAALRVELVEIRDDSKYSKTLPRPKPLLLLRKPNENGYPYLDREALSDFASVQNSSSTQSVIDVVSTACSGSQCYKVGVHNRVFAGDRLRYRLNIYLYTTSQSVFTIGNCLNSANASELNCNGKGKCLQTAGGPRCECEAGWAGIQCNSPTSLDTQQLAYAAKNISLLCTVCSESFSLNRGGMKIFRVPQSMKPNSGLQIQVRAQNNQTSTANPNLYISENLPRSVFDFEHVATSTKMGSESIMLSSNSYSGNFWVAVVLASDTATIDTIVKPNVADTRRMLAEESAITELLIDSQLVYIAGTSVFTESLVTDQSFLKSIWDWTKQSSVGLSVLLLTIGFMLLMFSYCVWRSLYAPDNQDKVLKVMLEEEIGGKVDALSDDDGPNQPLEDIETTSSVALTKRERAVRAVGLKLSKSTAVELPHKQRKK